jgi:acetyl esterase/lipase
MAIDDAPPFHPDLRRARYMPRTSATRRNRRLLRALTRIGYGRAPKGGELVDLGDGVTVRVQRPAADARTGRPAVLHLHGGGLIIGSATQGDPLCRRLADELGAVAASVDYRMPPEHPYPAPLDDAYAALQWLAAQPDVDPTRIAVIGESAGGGLAATLELAVPARRAEQGPSALSGLSPAWIGVGTRDLFHDEDVEYAQRLSEAGVPCELHVIPGAYHGFDASEPKAAVSRDFVQHQLDALRGMLGVAQ